MGRRFGFVLCAVLVQAALGFSQSVEISARTERLSEGPYILVTYDIPEGLHQEENPELFTFTALGPVIGKIEYPLGETRDGRVVYRGRVTLKAPLIQGFQGEALIKASYQLCDESGTCFIPKTIDVRLEIGEILAEKSSQSFVTTLLFILLAFAGGIILNVMPCVLPVLSIKALGIIKQSGQNNLGILRQSLAYTAGIIVSFIVLAAVVVMLKLLGKTVGWGFQFQSPGYILVLLSVVFLFALSLFDVFVIEVPSLGVFSRIGGKGMLSSFLGGIFAVVLATPCTAPLLGTALGFAFSQPPALIFVFFIAIGLGLSLPFLLVGFFPSSIKGIPKPGPWMSVVKEVMGFFLLLTALWLLSVIGEQRGGEGIIRSLGFLFSLALASWVFGRFGKTTERLKKRILSLIAALLIAGLGAIISLSGFSPRSGSGSDGAIKGEGRIPRGFLPFSDEALDSALSEGRPVFVAFSAKWCLTCMTNEKTVLSRKVVQDRFAEKGVTLLYADYTNPDEGIASWLSKFGRAGVPLYLFYKSGAKTPEILPEILSQAAILSLLDE
jgi:thiol:disulfide interchange protein